MNPSPALGQEKSHNDPSSHEQVRQRFTAAWEDTARGAAEPTVEAFLDPFTEPERSQVRSELEALDQSFRERRSAVQSRPADGEAAGTVDHQPAAAGETGEYQPAGAGATGEYAPAGPGVTGEYVPGPGETEDEVRPRRARAPIPKTVAGYEILGLLGRGAFGVVYKARQPGLKRVVALKMVLAGGHADEHELARFRSEAEVIARLQHPNIVQVYEVGEEEGRPFFSLEYVDGTSLKEKLAGTPQPPREAAALLRTLAEAMAYAHQHNIVHRDLKPGNVLLTHDGVPKVGDFGLARRLEEDSGQTRTGSAVGTPSYMAPEQAEGRSREAGPLADVYSLGAVLYEVLTGRAPFRGASVLETLEQVRKREPVAPTQLQPGVPRDLETICLKCLHKEPGRRYANAGALAEDLRRFLAGEPIQARPVSRAERAWRWCKRNPWVAGPFAAAALLVVGWAITATVLLANLRRENAAKEEARGQAVANAKKAETAADMAKQKHDQGMTVMVDFVGALYNQMRSKRLASRHDPDLVQLRRDMVEQLRSRMLAAVKQMDQQGVSTFGAARTYQQLGDLMARLGQGTEALRLYRQGEERARKISEEQPDNDVARGDIGLLLVAQGDVLLDLIGDARAALAAYQQAWNLHHELLTNPRSGEYTETKVKSLLAFDDRGLGKTCLYLGDPAAARKHFQECRTHREEWTKAEPNLGDAWSYLAEAHMWLGIVAWHLGDARGVTEHFGECVGICEKLAKLDDNDFYAKADLANIYGSRGDAELQLGKVAEADKSYRHAQRNMQLVMAHDPNDTAQVPLLALTHERLAALAARRGNRTEADKQYQEALQLREELVQIEPNNLAWQAGHALALARCGKHAEAAAGAEKLRKQAPRSTDLLLQAARCYAVCAALDTPRKQEYTAKALEALRTATHEEYRDAVALETDPDLEGLRREPAYQAIVAAVKSRS
jgi:serine/threonine-protein kinase